MALLEAPLRVHKKTVVACVRVPGGTGQRDQHVRTFGTTTAELLALRDWLDAYGVTHVALESTGVYWKPIFYMEDPRLVNRFFIGLAIVVAAASVACSLFLWDVTPLVALMLVAVGVAVTFVIVTGIHAVTVWRWCS